MSRRRSTSFTSRRSVNPAPHLGRDAVCRQRRRAHFYADTLKHCPDGDPLEQVARLIVHCHPSIVQHPLGLQPSFASSLSLREHLEPRCLRGQLWG